MSSVTPKGFALCPTCVAKLDISFTEDDLTAKCQCDQCICERKYADADKEDEVFIKCDRCENSETEAECEYNDQSLCGDCYDKIAGEEQQGWGVSI